MEGKHILICGERGIGKSTLIQKLLAHNKRPVYGYVTRRTPLDLSNNGYHDIYIYRASDTIRTQSPENYVGWCESKKRSINPAVFEQAGTEYLRAREDGILVMDEIGFMETAAPGFCASIMRHLDGSIPVLAAVKDKPGVPFLEQVRNHPNAALYTITEANRDELYETLLPIIRSWNKEDNEYA